MIFPPPILAAGAVLLAAAAGSGDYEPLTPPPERTCVVRVTDCATAHEAMRRGCFADMQVNEITGCFAPVASTAGSSDFELITPLSERICAKSHATCEAARAAVAKGWFLGELPRDAVTECRPAPNCFTERSGCIEGYNCEARR